MAKKNPMGGAMGGADPFPYDGPIERADGVRPYNHYLWPTESWWPHKEPTLCRWCDSRWHFGIIALADGTFSIEGCVWSIERNDYCGKPCVYSTRVMAIRTAAARMIRVARKSGNWGSMYGGLKGKQLAEVINWARGVVARETGRAEPKTIHVKEPPTPYRPTGLPLFDFGK